MVTKNTKRQQEQAATDAANALAELDAAKLYRPSGNTLVDHNEGAPNVSSLNREALEVVERPPDKDKEDPSLVRILYHAYDGRVVPVPAYMAPKKLAERFPYESFIPVERRGQRVWFLESPQSTPRIQLRCMLHSSQDEVTKELVTAAGLTPGSCSKSNIPSAFALENHMRLKHKREWLTIETVRNQRRDAEWRADSKAQTEAMLEIVRHLAAQGPRAEPN